MFTWIPGTSFADAIIGLTIALGFIASLSLLSPPNSRGEFAIRLAATLSSATALGLERANIDIAIFTILALSATAISKQRWLQSFGYAAIIGLGLLKLYPYSALLLAIRQRLNSAIVIGISGVLSLVWLIFSFWDGFYRMIAGVPSGGAFYMQFGSTELANGIAGFLYHSGSLEIAAGAYHPRLEAIVAATAIRLGLLASMFVLAFLLQGKAERFGVSLPAHKSVRLLMVTGSVVVLFCFAAGPNFIYRAIFLLMVLPGMFAMSSSRQTRAAMIITLTAAAMALAMWMPTLHYPLEHYSLTRFWPTALPIWLSYQLVWWWFATFMAAILISFVRQSEAWTELKARLPDFRTAVTEPAPGQ
jgi:hypothetical protein